MSVMRCYMSPLYFAYSSCLVTYRAKPVIAIHMPEDIFRNKYIYHIDRIDSLHIHAAR